MMQIFTLTRYQGFAQYLFSLPRYTWRWQLWMAGYVLLCVHMTIYIYMLYLNVAGVVPESWLTCA